MLSSYAEHMYYYLRIFIDISRYVLFFCVDMLTCRCVAVMLLIIKKLFNVNALKPEYEGEILIFFCTLLCLKRKRSDYSGYGLGLGLLPGTHH